MEQSDVDRIIEEARSQKSLELSLDECGLTSIPSAIFELTWLTRLSLSDNEIEEVPAEISNLTNLVRLDLWDNPLQSIHDSIGQLGRLQKLAIGPKVPSLPDSIGRCKGLIELSIGGNELGKLPPWVLDLHNLQELQLWGNKLMYLPDNWSGMKDLRVVNLSKNDLRSLPASFSRLRKLESADLGSNHFDRLPQALLLLTRLEVLTLRDNLITNVPPHIDWLPNLVHLDLSLNRIVDLPNTIGALHSLEFLDLSLNPLSRFPQEIGEIAKLEELILVSDPDWYGGFHAVAVQEPDDSVGPERPRSFRMEGNRHSLDLANERSFAAYEMRLGRIPTGLASHDNLRTLALVGNSDLGIPAEVLDHYESASSILSYYFALEQSGAKPLNEAKLIVLGWGGAGKTSIVNRLVHGRFYEDESRTEGINVDDWNVSSTSGQSIRLHVWDFGGQEIMHATHQFFLTSRSIYLIVLNGRSGAADADAEYWLKIVHSFASESPIIIVRNQVLRDPFELDEAALRRRYPNITAIVDTDCAAGRYGYNIDILEGAISKTLGSLRDLDVQFPLSWFAIKDRIASMKEDYLSDHRFRSVCRAAGEMSDSEQEKLARYLHLLGVALNYRDDVRLRDTNILNPRWVTDGIYAILNAPSVAQRQGELLLSDMSVLLPASRYPADKQLFLIDLMRKFELCFPFDDTSTRYLVPELLPKQEPEELEGPPVTEETLRFEYNYPVLPEGLLPRFIVRSHQHSSNLARWRSGVVLKWDGNTAFVHSDSATRSVSITVAGPLDGRRRLLAVIRSDLDRINSDYSFYVEAVVPISEPMDFSIAYDELVVAENEGKTTYEKYVAGRFVTVDVKKLLNGVDVPGRQRSLETRGEAVSRASIFISYSHVDEQYKDRFLTELKLLQHLGEISVWHDRRIPPTANWQDEIDERLAQAQIFVALVSADFLASDYIRSRELSAALERSAKGELLILPVIIRPCNWKLSDLSPIQAVPEDGRPISKWENVDEAWASVGDATRRAAVGDSGRRTSRRG